MNKLVKQLVEESQRPKARFDSTVYRQALQQGPSIVPKLVKSIKQPSYKNYLALEAVRELQPESWASIPASLRVAIYGDALKHAVIFNDWGLAGEYFDETARALMQLGEQAIPSLAVLLDDRRLAPCFGSEESTISKDYQNRVCDYAFVMISELMGQSIEYPFDPQSRDTLIGELKKKLASK
jgi:hypothetical protein